MNPARPKFAKKPIAALAGQQNGLLDASVLAVSNVRGLRLNIVSVRKFNALQNAAIRDGVALSSTGDYRTLAQQISLLQQRADPGYIAGRPWYRTWNGQTWSGKPGTAQVATPGTSNHGDGRSRDFAEMVNGDTIPDSLTTRAKQWLAANAPRFGIYFETESEDWHGTDYDGDVIAQAVLDEEGGMTGSPIPAFDPVNGMFSLYPLNPNKDQIWLKDPHFKSDLVAYLQGVLRKAGYSVYIDGDFGPKTDTVVKQFQKDKQLTVDGRVGPKTWAKIDEIAVQGTQPTTPTIPTYPEPHPVEGDMTITLFRPPDCAAQFFGMTSPTGAALWVEWTGDGGDLKVQNRIRAHLDAGCRVDNTTQVSGFINCTLIGPLPQGDNRHVWTGAEFARVVT
jgi:peptidoglycan hydrolase-like protein with peptidoglycan-binding domain